MNSFRQFLQTTTAQAHYLLSRSLGEQISFSNRGAVAVTLYCIPASKATTAIKEGGAVSENRAESFEIALQTGFAATNGDIEPVSIGDVVTYQSRAYVVESYNSDEIGAVYILNCTENKRLSTGVE